MREFVSGTQMKQLDRYTIQEIGIPSLVLMERAARSVYDTMIKERLPLKKVLVLCGSGNNGADGVALARMLHLSNISVDVEILGNPSHFTTEMKQQIEIAKKYQVVLYTGSADNMLYHVENRGYLDYNTQMPVMFNSSKINLNITLRSIQSGISLRALDIMGAGGFLISNWQPELAECFEEGKEVVMYYDRNDLMSKIEYYLQNEDERMKIAENGQKKIIEQFDYSCAWKKVFGVVF